MSSILAIKSELDDSVMSSEAISGELAVLSMEAFTTDTEMPSRLLIRSHTFFQTRVGGSTEVTQVLAEKTLEGHHLKI